MKTEEVTATITASVWVYNQYGTPIGYKTPDGRFQPVANAAILVFYAKRKARKEQKEEDHATIER